MSSIVTIVGPLGRDPEIKPTKKGNEYMTLAVGSRYAKVVARGKVENQTQWNRVVITSPALVKGYRPYLSTGTMVMVVGQIQNSHQEVEIDGKKRTIKRTSIVVGPHDRFTVIPTGRRKEPISKEDAADIKDDSAVEVPSSEPTAEQLAATEVNGGTKKK